MMNKENRSWISLIIIFTVCTMNMHSQTFSMRHKHGSWISAELNVPQCKEVVDVHNDWYTSKYGYNNYSGFVLNIDAKVEVFEDNYLVLESYLCKEKNNYRYVVTSSYMGNTYSSGYNSNMDDFYYGNIFVGMDISTSIPNLRLEFGGRIPALISHTKWSENIGAFHDLERIDASLTVATLKCLANYSNRDNSNGIYYSLTAGPEFWFMDKFQSGGGIYLFHQAFLGYNFNSFSFSVGINGLLTGIKESPFNSSKTIHYMVYNVSYDFGNFIPEMIFRLPFKINRGVSSVLGLGLAYKMN